MDHITAAEGRSKALEGMSSFGQALDGRAIPFTRRFIQLCSRPMGELCFVLTAKRVNRGIGGGVGVGVSGEGVNGSGTTPMKKVRPYR